MYEVVYNACFGGFSLSAEAVRMAQSAAGKDSAWSKVKESYGYIDMKKIPRHDPILVSVVKRLGDRANGLCANLRIAEIESNTYRIDEYDGNESVETPGNINWTVIK